MNVRRLGIWSICVYIFMFLWFYFGPIVLEAIYPHASLGYVNYILRPVGYFFNKDLLIRSISPGETPRAYLWFKIFYFTVFYVYFLRLRFEVGELRNYFVFTSLFILVPLTSVFAYGRYPPLPYDDSYADIKMYTSRFQYIIPETEDYVTLIVTWLILSATFFYRWYSVRD